MSDDVRLKHVSLGEADRTIADFTRGPKPLPDPEPLPVRLAREVRRLEGEARHHADEARRFRRKAHDAARTRERELEKRAARRMADAPARVLELEHALGHVVDCGTACPDCLRLAASALRGEGAAAGDFGPCA